MVSLCREGVEPSGFRRKVSIRYIGLPPFPDLSWRYRKSPARIPATCKIPDDAAPRPAATRCSGPLTDFGRSSVAGDTHNRGHFTRASAASLIPRTRAFDGAQRPPCAVNRVLASTTPTPASAVNALAARSGCPSATRVSQGIESRFEILTEVSPETGALIHTGSPPLPPPRPPPRGCGRQTFSAGGLGSYRSCVTLRPHRSFLPARPPADRADA